MTYWNNRPLTEMEQRFRNAYRCIACGAKVSVLRRNGVEPMWPFECAECARVRGRRNDSTGADFGAARASIQHAADAAMGYSTTNCGRHDRTDDPMKNQDRLDRDEAGRLKVYNPKEKWGW